MQGMQTAVRDVERRKGPWGKILLLIASIGLGASGVYFANDYITSEVEGYRRQLEKTEPMVDVVVPSRNLSRGDTVSESVMSVRSIPAQYVDTHSVTAESFNAASGQRLDFDIDAGTPLLWAHLEGGLTPTFSGKVPDGMRALTVHVDEINSVSGFLQPKDKIDLLFTHGAGDKQKIRPLIENLAVIATGIQTMVDKASYRGQRAFTTITVQVTPIDAKRITLAQQIGSLTAVLRNPEDTGDISDKEITLASLLGEPVTPKPKPRRNRPSVVKASEPKIEIIIGGRR